MARNFFLIHKNCMAFYKAVFTDTLDLILECSRGFRQLIKANHEYEVLNVAG